MVTAGCSTTPGERCVCIAQYLLLYFCTVCPGCPLLLDQYGALLARGIRVKKRFTPEHVIHHALERAHCPMCLAVHTPATHKARFLDLVPR